MSDPRNVFDRRPFPFEPLKFVIQRGENFLSEPRSDSPHIVELPVLVSTKEERAKIFSRARWLGITQNDEFVLLVHLYLEPLATSPFDIYRCQSLRHQPFVSSLFCNPKSFQAIC